MADTFYATLELKNIRMDGFLFSFCVNIHTTRYSATEFGRNKPTNFRLSGTLKRTYEPTEKLTLQIHSWQVNANVFKVMRVSLLRDYYLISLFFAAL